MNDTGSPLLLDPLTDRELEVLRLMADGFSNPEIADRLILGVETVRWYTKQIYSKLGVHSRTQASMRARDLGLLDGRYETFSSPPAEAPPSSLPTYVTPFVGRDGELAEISALLTDPGVRLITIAGPGGMGKTRLAVEVARTQSEHFSDGVYFVPLLSARSTDEIDVVIASHLKLKLRDDVNPSTQILHFLHQRRLLLILDNFEHVLNGAERVASILETAPQVKILVTSQASLNLRGEWVRYLDALSVPNGAMYEIQAYPAVQLFYDRVRRVRGDFSLNDQLECVVHICSLVQGVPLAIELAAAWLKTLTCKDVAKEIQHNIDFLTTTHRDIEERHRSIQAVFEYAWNLLTPEEQSVFRRLSVFRGGFGLTAAQQVAGVSVHTLSELVSRSLLQQNEDGLYEIHNLLRQYGERKLETLDDGARSLRSSKLLAWSSLVKGNFEILKEVADDILQVTSDRSDVEEKGFALAALGVLAGVEGDYSRCLQLGEASQTLVRRDPIATIFSQFALAIAGCGGENYSVAKRNIRAALVQATGLGSSAFIALCLPVASIVLAHLAEPERAVEVMGLAFTHPASTLGWVEKWPLIAQLRFDLVAELGEKEYAVAWERGKSLDLDTVAGQLLAEF